jgi:hypothetical protein
MPDSTLDHLRDYLEERLDRGFAAGLIPEHMHEGVRAYVLDHYRGGDFLTAIFSNDFLEAAGRADEKNQRAFFGWAVFLYNYVPIGCQGSAKKVKAWTTE